MELLTEGLTGNEKFYQESVFALPFALFLTSIIVKIVDQKFIYKSNEKLKDRGEEQIKHTLFFIPFQYWILILGTTSIVTFILRLT